MSIRLRFVPMLSVAMLLVVEHGAATAATVSGSCRSTCGNGAACVRLAKQVFAECVISTTSTADCGRNLATTRTACKAATRRCRDRCMHCSAQAYEGLRICEENVDPQSCIPRSTSDLFACLRGVGAPDDCAGYEGVATPGEVALSPFPDREAEQLAIEVSGEAVAPEDVYSRIVVDLAVIRALHPELRVIGAMPSWVLDELTIGFDATGSEAVVTGTYTDWNCRNLFYGAAALAHRVPVTRVRYRHLFNMTLLAAEYASLPHVSYAEPTWLLGDGHDVCASSDGATFTYVFDAGSGDCPAGCTRHTYWGFAVSSPGAVVSLGTWSDVSGEPPPQWLAALADCRKWL